MRAHLRWLVPLALIPATFYGATFAMTKLSETEGSATAGLLVFALFLFAIAGPVVAMVFTFKGIFRVYGDWRRSRGRYTKAEKIAIETQNHLDEAWIHARTLHSSLIKGQVPDAIKTQDVIPNAEEDFYFDLNVEYARFYGHGADYAHAQGLYFGNPLFVVAAMGITAAGNVSRRNAAEAQAATQWREIQNCRVLVSNQRILCLVRGRWLSFYHSAVVAIYPEPGRWTLVCQFEQSEPLLLRGPWSPTIGLIATYFTRGPSALSEHPGFEAFVIQS